MSRSVTTRALFRPSYSLKVSYRMSSVIPQPRLPTNRVTAWGSSASSALAFLAGASSSSSALRFLEGSAAFSSSLSSESDSESSESSESED